jgi:phosphopantetheinyl transferase (holo-ACP synthase)
MANNTKCVKCSVGKPLVKKDIENLLPEGGLENLERYVRENELSYDEAIGAIKKYVNGKTSLENFEEFLIEHGLANLSIGNRKLSDEIKEIFDSKNNTVILKDTIIEHGGAISIDQLINNPEGNIFDNFCEGWEDSARELCCLRPGKSVIVGSGEVFLNILIKGASSRNEGDLIIEHTHPFEVKSITSKNDVYKSGPHSAGRKGRIRLAWELYAYMNTYMFNNGAITDNAAAKLAYFQNNDGLKKFNNKLVKSCLQKYAAENYDDVIRAISNTFVDAIFYQYGFIHKRNCINRFKRFIKSAVNEYDVIDNAQMSNLSGEYTIREAVNKIFRASINQDTGFSNMSIILDVLGAVQLYLYSQIEKFEYIIFLCLDEDTSKITSKNGKYLFIYGCTAEGEENPLTNIEKIIDKLQFKALDMPMHTLGKTGKIFFK